MNLVRNRAYEFGVRGIDMNALSLDSAAVVARKDGIVGGIVDGIYGWVNPNPNITFIRGQAEFTSPVDIKVDGKSITADKSIVATGSRTAENHIVGLAEVGFITNRQALKLTAVPSSLIVIGGGYVGVEFAQMYARFGTRVTLISRSERIMPQEETELSEQLVEVLRAEGIDVRVGTTAIRAEKSHAEKVVVAQANGQEERFQAEEILFAAGHDAKTGVSYFKNSRRAKAIAKLRA